MWSWGRYLLTIVTTGLGGLLGGCGLYPPDIVEFDNQPHATAFLINRIVDHVKCELRQAVQHAHNYDIEQAALQPEKRRRIAWPDSSIAKVTMACTRFRGHRVRCFDGTGGVSWRDGSLHASSSLRLCG
jgi:hypothetical protein